MEKNSMDTVIVDAIKMIVEASKGNVSYDVETIFRTKYVWQKV